jgi:hypothetical protein
MTLKSFIRYKIPRDNSCLFRAVDFLLVGRTNNNAPTKWRTLCAQHIRNHPEKYSAVYLGQNVDNYCNWLLLNSSWGGETEIIILCELNDIQISVIQIEASVGILTYSPSKMTDRVKRIYILYTGEHYDAIINRQNNRCSSIISKDFRYTEKLALACGQRHKKELEKEKRIQKFQNKHSECFSIFSCIDCFCN